MNALTIRRQRALHNAATKHDLRAAQAHLHSASSTPNLQRHLESGAGIALMLIVGLAFLAFAASGGFR